MIKNYVNNYTQLDRNAYKHIHSKSERQFVYFIWHVSIDGPQNIKLKHNRGSAPSALNLTEGTSLKLTCKTHCSPPCNITWSKNDEIQSHDRKKYLKITQIWRTQSGIYHCQARGVEGELSSEGVAVTVQCKYSLFRYIHNLGTKPYIITITLSIFMAQI